MLSSNFFPIFAFRLEIVVICREVSLCLSDELPWDWETWSSWSCSHRWAGAAGIPSPGEGAACPQKEQARRCGYRECRTWQCPVPPSLLKISSPPEPSKAGRRQRRKGRREYEQVLHWPFSRPDRCLFPQFSLETMRLEWKWLILSLPAWLGWPQQNQWVQNTVGY